LRVWEQPQPDTQYIIGGDVAQGLSKRDPSCATVLEMSIKGFDIYFRQVAQLHGWLNPKTYAEELTKLALWYNEALVVVERNGPGAETLRNIKEWGYWNMFVDMSDPAQAHFTLDPLLGVNTDRSSKPVMVGCLQQVIKDRRTGKRSIDIPCADTLDELGLFVQELAAAGQSYKFQAATGMTDDRVMSLVVAVYAAKAFGVYDFGKDVLRQKKQAAEKISAQERAVWAELHKQLGEDARE
jgi:hypothetical protein